MDSGGLYLPGFLLRNYVLAGVDRLEFLAIAHIAAYHWESPESEGARPSLRTIADQMGYARRKEVRRLIHNLAARTWTPSDPTKRGSGEDAGPLPMLHITKRPGRPSLYIAHGLARACLEIELARTLSIRNGRGEEDLIEYLLARDSTSPPEGPTIKWSMTDTSPEEGPTLPRGRANPTESAPPIQGEVEAPPPPKSGPEEKILFLINTLNESEEDTDQPPQPQNGNGSELLNLWARLSEYLKNEMAPATFSRYVESITGATFHTTRSVLELEAPTEEIGAWVDQRLKKTIERQLIGIIGADATVEVIIKEKETT